MNVRLPIQEDPVQTVQAKAAPVQVPSLLYEMIRSFTTLARTLNLSHAVAELGSTRQTVRRHIAQLEEVSGNKLFSMEGHHYTLTTHGIEMLPEADDLLARGKLWITGQAGHVNNLMRFSHEAPNGWAFFQQHQPLNHAWDLTSSLFRDCISAWSRSEGYLEAPEFQKMRPFVLVYRHTPHGWICVEIGEESFYAQWWGWANARSSIGRGLGEFPGGPEFENLINQSFEEVQASGGLRLDEVVTQIPRSADTPPEPLAYHRLLMGGRFPDGSFALITVVDRSETIRIKGLDQEVLELMPADARVTYPA